MKNSRNDSLRPMLTENKNYWTTKLNTVCFCATKFQCLQGSFSKDPFKNPQVYINSMAMNSSAAAKALIDVV
jgi:hypothetical protein